MTRRFETNVASEIASLADGRAVLMNFHIGMGLKIDEETQSISVCENPIKPGYDGPALRSFMRRIISSWQKNLDESPAIVEN